MDEATCYYCPECGGLMEKDDDSDDYWYCVECLSFWWIEKVDTPTTRKHRRTVWELECEKLAAWNSSVKPK